MKFINDLVEKAKKLEKLAAQNKMGLWSKEEFARQLKLVNGYTHNPNLNDFNENLERDPVTGCRVSHEPIPDNFSKGFREGKARNGERVWDEYKENHDEIF